MEYFNNALKIKREIGDRSGEGAILDNIGTIYISLENYNEAIKYFQMALVIYQNIGNRSGEGVVLNNLGVAFSKQRRYIEALDHYKKSLAIQQEIGGQMFEGDLLGSIGGVYYVQGRHAEALEYYEQAMGVFETLRATAGSEIGRASFISQYTYLYQGVTELYVEQGQSEQAFFTSERGRSRSFLDSLSTGYVQLADNEAEALWSAEQSTYTARYSAQEALAKAKAQNPPDIQLDF